MDSIARRLLAGIVRIERVVVFLNGDTVRLSRPGTQIDHLATFGAEWAIGIVRIPHHAHPALRADDDRLFAGFRGCRT